MDDADRAEFHESEFHKFLLTGNANAVKNLETPRADCSNLCVECGQPIPAKRLKIFPGALRCVKCQEELESEGKTK